MTEGRTSARPVRGPAVFPVLLVNFIGTLGFSIVLPFLVFLVTRFGGNALVYGLVGATYPAFQLLGAPLLGEWSDRFGRRRILLLSQAGTMAAWILFAVALYMPLRTLVEIDSTTWGQFSLTLPLLVLFVARALDGLTGGNISVANAYLADVTPEADRSRNFGRMGISSSLGFVLGPAAAGLLGALGYGEAPPVFAALLVSFVAILLIAFALPESRPRPGHDGPDRRGLRRSLGQEPVDCTRVPESRRAGALKLLRCPGLARIFALYFLIFLGFSFFYVAFPVRAARDLEWTVGQTGLFFAFMSVLAIVVQGPVLSALSPRFPERVLIVGGSLLLAVNFVMMTAETTSVIYAGAALFALGNGLMWPSVQAVLSRVAPPDLQGAAQGFAGAASSLASICGMLLGGFLFDRVGVVTFLGAAGAMILVAMLSAAWLGAGPRPATLAPQGEARV